MKKHFFRILTVVLMACLGVGILAACGGDPENPEDTIEGVWTNEIVTITIENNKAVMKDLEGEEGVEYSYYVLTEEDGYYSAGENKKFTLTETGLTVQLPSIEGEPTTIALTAHDKQIPAHVSLSGKYNWILDPSRPQMGSQTVDFTGGTIDGKAVTFIQVGEYSVVEENAWFDSMDIFFKTGDQVFACPYIPAIPGGMTAVELQAAAD